MSEETTLEAYADKQELIDNIDEIFETTVKDLLVEQDAVHVVLTGGTVGIALLENIDPGHVLDWSRIHLWWGDERFVPAGHADRNEGQATAALIHRLPIPAENVHRMPASDAGLSLDEAVDAYDDELAKYWPELPEFDITFLGVGPDAHIASLFPGLDGIEVDDRAVIAVRNSPKPPAERISLTLPALNNSKNIWVVAAGADKADAIYAAFTSENPSEAPVSAVEGTEETVFFTDEAAAQRLIEEEEE
jgi:6-phosphogluconolactonase